MTRMFEDFNTSNQQDEHLKKLYAKWLIDPLALGILNFVATNEALKKYYVDATNTEYQKNPLNTLVISFIKILPTLTLSEQLNSCIAKLLIE
jgi:hypothetical protein